ncbi:MAG: hypothetical protein ACLT8E_07670 [Akkermansia sp.]
MLQRIGMAQAWSNPRLLVLDEPTAGVDPWVREISGILSTT